MATRTTTLPPEKTAVGRIQVIDALRGFALLGIVIVHMAEFYIAGPIPPDKAEIVEGGMVDEIINVIESILIRGKFFAIFSVLFGLSFFIQMEKGEKREDAFHWRFLWRLVLLFGFGWLHGLFYRGDILSIYAMLGVPLILFYKVPNRWLWVCIVILMAGVPKIGAWTYNHITNPPTEETAVISEGDTAEENTATDENIAPTDSASAENRGPFNYDWESETKYFNTITEGTILQVFNRNATYGFKGKMDFQFVNGTRGYLTLGLFLIGLYLGRKRFFEKYEQYKKDILMWTWVSFGVALGTVLVVGLLMRNGPPEGDTIVQPLLMALFDIVNTGLLTIWVVGIFLLLYMKKGPRKFFDWMVPYGRAGLTNYVTQSIIGTFIFFGWGLGMLGTIKVALASLIALSVFAVQAFISKKWLETYKYGPLEWLWRSATYLKWQPMRK
ncbi:MAG: DUF418 domain-containing protein [Bacteroidota bacterium]